MRTRRGYLLMEMMVVLGLFVVVGGMAIGIVRWSLMYMQSTQLAESSTAALNQAMEQLRGDVWCAGSLRSTDRQTLQLDVDGKSITWRLSDDGSITRTDSRGARNWEAGLSGASFTAEGNSVRLIVPSAPASRGGRISMMSQFMLLGAKNQ